MTFTEKQNLLKSLIQKQYPSDNLDLINARMLGQLQAMMTDEQLDYLIEYNSGKVN